MEVGNVVGHRGAIEISEGGRKEVRRPCLRILEIYAERSTEKKAGPGGRTRGVLAEV